MTGLRKNRTGGGKENDAVAKNAQKVYQLEMKVEKLIMIVENLKQRTEKLETNEGVLKNLQERTEKLETNENVLIDLLERTEKLETNEEMLLESVKAERATVTATTVREEIGSKGLYKTLNSMKANAASIKTLADR